MQETKAKSSQFGDMALESTQTGFVQKLLKECKTKVIAVVGWVQLFYFIDFLESVLPSITKK